MRARRYIPLGVLVLSFMTSPTVVHSQRLLGMKGHRGHGALELLLATGILAKLLNHRSKHGGTSGRNILHALLGGPRYPANNMRYPLEMPSHHALLQDDLLNNHVSMGMSSLDHASLGMSSLGHASMFAADPSELMLNQESALLAARAPLLMDSSSQLLAAEAQLSQQLLAARRARRLLEAKKLLAAQEASTLLAAQSEMAATYAAAQEAAQTQAMFADQSRQVFTSMMPPKHMNPHHRPQTAPIPHHKKLYHSNQPSTTSMNQYMAAEASNTFQSMVQPPPQMTPQPVYRPQNPPRPAYIHSDEARQATARSGHLAIPAGMSDADAARIIAHLAV